MTEYITVERRADRTVWLLKSWPDVTEIADFLIKRSDPEIVLRCRYLVLSFANAHAVYRVVEIPERGVWRATLVEGTQL